jgi:hypothetical protein
MNIIYICVFHQHGYIDLLKLLIVSLSIKSNINKQTTDILIITSLKFQLLIQEAIKDYNMILHYYILDLHTLMEAACARLNIFEYENINLYDKILYLDTYILINSDINILLNLELLTDKIYVLEEGNIGHPYWGSFLFDFSKYNRRNKAFTSGILFFNNNDIIKELFKNIKLHILKYLHNGNNKVPYCLDQPFIVYHAIKDNNYDNQLLKTYVENNPTIVSPEKIIYHFPGDPGHHLLKYCKMNCFLEKILGDFYKIKICQYGIDGFGHQLEGMLRLISLSLNNKAEYQYKHRKNYEFEHNNADNKKLEEYLTTALDILSNNIPEKNIISHEIIYNENRDFKTIIINDKNFRENIYQYDGVCYVRCDNKLPPNFETKQEIIKSLPLLREAFVEKNIFLPKPSYNDECINVCCHIRLGDAIGTRHLDNESLYDVIRYYQLYNKYRVSIHSDGNIDFLEATNTILYKANTDVLQILSDFINADILLMNYSSLSIAAHLLAKDTQQVICPNKAGATFFDRILDKCITANNFIISLPNHITNKTYTWQNDTITFSENGKMNAFGIGNYIQTYRHVFQADFGCKQHILKFNNNYTEFISMRVCDKEVVVGTIVLNL